MANRLEWYDVTIPANTAKTSPITVPTVFQLGTVVRIDIKVLDGPSGLMGFFVAAGGSQYVPRTRGSFIRPNADYMVWQIEDAITSGSWAVTGYNLDVWDHNVQVGYHVNEDTVAQYRTGLPIGSSAQSVTDALGSLLPADITSTDPLSPTFLVDSVPPPDFQNPPPPDKTPPPIRKHPREEILVPFIPATKQRPLTTKGR